MAVFKKILVPFDGSESSENAAKQAIALASDQNAELIGLKVIAFEGEIIPPSDDLWKVIMDDLRERAMKTLEKLASESEKKGIPVRREVRMGYVEEEIVALVEEMGIDLVVMGLGEKVGMHRVSIRRLVADSPCPIMMIH